MHAARCFRRGPLQEIHPTDLDAVADLLTAGFPRRNRNYWVAALRYLQQRDTPEGFPRYGHLLVQGDRIAGVVLLIFTAGINGLPQSIRCNVSSWYVIPEFRALAPLLVHRALRHKQVTFINTSPADNTVPTIKAQGFERYCTGVFAATPALTLASLDRQDNPAVGHLRAQDYLMDFEVALLRDHAACGCLSLILQHNGNSYPIILRRRLVRPDCQVLGVPCAQLIYVRDLECVVRFSGLIGRYLALRGMPVLLISARSENHWHPWKNIIPGGRQCIIKGQTGRVRGSGLHRRLRCSVLKTEFTVGRPVWSPKTMSQVCGKLKPCVQRYVSRIRMTLPTTDPALAHMRDQNGGFLTALRGQNARHE